MAVHTYIKCVLCFTVSFHLTMLAFETIPNLINVACVNLFTLWMLKYPNWQQKKNNQRRLFLPSLGEEMVTQHISRNAESGNVKKHSQCNDSNGSILQTKKKQQLPLQPMTETRKTASKMYYLSNSQAQKNQIGNFSSDLNGHASTTPSRRFM